MQYLFGSEIPVLALNFRDYIRTRYQVELELKEITDDNGNQLHALFIAEDCPKLAEITQEKQRFIRDPFNDRYEQASWQSGDVGTARTHTWQRMPNIVQLGQHVLHNGKFTLFLTVLCVLIYLLQLGGFNDEVLELAHYPAYPDEKVQLWRYFTHSLVHLSPLHILFNLVWWWIFGGAIERTCGSGKLVTLYLVAAVLTGIAQNIASDPAFFGLSGVVYAVLGYVLVADKYGARKPFALPQGFFTMLLVGIAVGFITPLIDIQMGNTAHISGLIIGCLFGFFDAKSVAGR
ncbi:rhomboid family intramembrane serine protease [Necropsobacter massiliensis]|uniref:rhomboid family intramembrane serine protease n=1 Tax=Necropsobacter massiliensis TaxID=1400001 RepID=UPI000595F5E5|nr:rhomboid family intramembrane serine protease [Necropsobacter massiliensis]